MKHETPRHCWCGETRSRRLYGARSEHGDAVTVHECRGCRVRFLWPMPTDKQLARAYAADYYGATRKKFVGPLSDLIRWFQQGRARTIAQQLPRSARVLDVGCGNGGFLRDLKQMGYRVEGTEWSAESASRVPRSWRIPIHAGDLLNLGLPAHRFDCITLWHVFEHLPQPDETLKEIHRILKPGGLLVMAMPNMDSWQGSKFGPHWFHLDPPRHLFHFGVKSLKSLLARSGFRTEDVATWSMEQNPYGILQSWLNARGFPRERAYSALKGTSKAPLPVRLIDLSLVAALAPIAIAAAIAESMAGRGGTMTITARSTS